MRIGKNIHTENKKKVYRKPVVEVVNIDREISLMLETGDLPDHSESEETLPSGTSTTGPDYGDKYTSPKNDSPFGGGTVDFQR